jgi:hypothetical protein
MYKIIKNLISQEECEKIYNEFINSQIRKDNQVTNSDIIYSSELGNHYSNILRPIAEDFFGIPLKGVRVYIRKSFTGNILEKHKDVTRYVISIFIKQDGDGINPLYIYSENGEKNEIVQNVGDGVMFQGSKFFHQRPPIVSNFIIGMYVGYDEAQNKSI